MPCPPLEIRLAAEKLREHITQPSRHSRRERDIRTALKGIDTALKALEMFAKLSGQLQGSQHNHLHVHAEVPSKEEAVEAARECLEVFAPHLLAAAPVLPIDVSRSSEGEPPGESNAG